MGAFFYWVDDYYQGNRRLNPRAANVCERIITKSQHDQVGRSVQPCLHGPLKVVRGRHRQAGALEHQGKD
jgi:hypothetical protein